MKRAIALFAKFPGKGEHDRLYEVAELVQRATNRVWWLWGQECGKFNKDITAHELQRAYKAGEKSDIKLFAMEPGFQSRAAQDLAGLYEQLHSRVATLIVNETVKRIKQTKSTIGAMPLWRACLLNLQNAASANYRHPICFDSQNAKLLADPLRLEVRIDRFFDGKSTNAKSNPITLELVDRKAKYNASRRASGAKDYVSPLEKILVGDDKFYGSEIVWQQKKRRWKVVLVVDVPEPVPLPDGAVMIVRPGENRCWETEIPGQSPIMLRNSPDRVSYLRKRLLAQKESRNDESGSSGRVGHGRKHRLRAAEPITGKWERVTRTMTKQIASELCRKALARGVTRVKYEPPQKYFALDKAGSA